MKIVLLAFLTLLVLPISSFATGLVDLNTATMEQIQALPGVGKKTAEAIVTARPFKSVNELKNVKGIGDAKFAKLKDSVAVSGSVANSPPIAISPVTATPSVPAAPAAAQTTMGKAAPVAKAKGSDLKPGELLNINTASADDLDRLPGIGPVKAKAIVAARPFSSVDDLTKVKGIKQATLEKVKPFITVK